MSESKASKNDSTCGSIIQPCASIAHALHISQDSDSILLDTSFEHISDQSLHINKAVTINSYGSISRSAVLNFTYSCYDWDGSFITISKDVSIHNIEIITIRYECAIFELDDPCQHVIIEHCNMITSTKDRGTTFIFKNKNLTILVINDTNLQTM